MTIKTDRDLIAPLGLWRVWAKGRGCGQSLWAGQWAGVFLARPPLSIGLSMPLEHRSPAGRLSIPSMGRKTGLPLGALFKALKIIEGWIQQRRGLEPNFVTVRVIIITVGVKSFHCESDKFTQKPLQSTPKKI